MLYVAFETIADATATYFISVSMLILTIMAVERWLHMSRRSTLALATLRNYLTAIVFLVIPTPLVVFRSLETIKPGSTGSTSDIAVVTIMSFSFLITFVAYFNVLRIIRSQQCRVPWIYNTFKLPDLTQHVLFGRHMAAAFQSTW